jgi:hypothetical protein
MENVINLNIKVDNFSELTLSETGFKEIIFRDRWMMGNEATSGDPCYGREACSGDPCYGREACSGDPCYGREACGGDPGDSKFQLNEKFRYPQQLAFPSKDASINELINARGIFLLNT